MTELTDDSNSLLDFQKEIMGIPAQIGAAMFALLQPRVEALISYMSLHFIGPKNFCIKLNASASDKMYFHKFVNSHILRRFILLAR